MQHAIPDLRNARNGALADALIFAQRDSLDLQRDLQSEIVSANAADKHCEVARDGGNDRPVIIFLGLQQHQKIIKYQQQQSERKVGLIDPHAAAQQYSSGNPGVFPFA